MQETVFGASTSSLRLPSHHLLVVLFCCSSLLFQLALADATESQPSITYYLLPQGDSRCQLASSRLRCLDQSVIVAATEPPASSDAILDEFLLCGAATTWAAVGCTQDDIGGDLAWQLAFLVTAPACGDRLVFNSSPDSPLVVRHQHWQSLPGGSPHQTVTFGCHTHAYPFLHRPAYKFTQMMFSRGAGWRSSSSSSKAKPVNVTMHVYARFHPDLPPAEHANKCAWRNGFWCSQGNVTCVYSTHECNGYDDCMDAPQLSTNEEAASPPVVAAAAVDRPANATTRLTGPDSTAGVSSDELGCRYNGHSGSGGHIIHDAHGYPWDDGSSTNAGDRIPGSSCGPVLRLLLLLLLLLAAQRCCYI